MRWMGDESASAMVEMAVALPLYILILVGIADYGYVIVQKIQVQEAAAAGAAYATIPGKYKDTDGMIAAARASTAMLGRSLTVDAVNVYACSSGGIAVGAASTCPSGGVLMFAQVTTAYTATTILRYAGFPATVTMQGFASYEVPWAP